jgi:hypothetical protein
MMSEAERCLVMIGNDFDPEWSEPRRTGVVSVVFKPSDYSYEDYIALEFEGALQAQAVKRNANLVCGLVFTPVPVASGSSGTRNGMMIVSGNAYYVPELDPEQEPSTSSSE